MIFREATEADIPQIQIVRHSVKENILSDPGLVTDADCLEFLTVRGKGWVCEVEKNIVGFAVADLKENNIWALFIRPEFEGRGIGQQLHNRMLDWYFACGKETVWLSTSPGTRAEEFYRKMGWVAAGLYGAEEVKFEMHRKHWQGRRATVASSGE